MKYNDYYLLIHKLLIGMITEEEERMLNEWIDRDANNKNTFEVLKMIWERADETDDFRSVDKDHFLAQRSRLDHNIKVAQKLELNKQRSKILYQSAAILLLLILSVSGFIAYLIEARLNGNTTIVVDKNQKVILSDSTCVILNKNSSLVFESSWKERKVKFEGIAYFDVAKDERPFVIALPIGELRVLGTTFFVSTTVEGYMEIHVTSGIVEVDYGNKKIKLRVGERASISKAQGILKEENHNPNFNAWLTGRIQFEKTEFVQIIKTLEDHFDVSCQVTNPDLLTCRFTGTFEYESFEEILKVLSYALDFNYTKDGKKYVIHGKGCKQ